MGNDQKQSYNKRFIFCHEVKTTLYAFKSDVRSLVVLEEKVQAYIYPVFTKISNL